MIRFAFFGTAPLAEEVLSSLEAAGHLPALVVAGADIPVRKSKEKMPPPEKAWAEARGIPVVQPGRLDDAFLDGLQTTDYDLFVVASYGKILPSRLLALPRRGVINLHPSLLPRLRGPSPIRSAILEDEKHIGVSIMLLDAEMDHGPLIAQEEVSAPTWPMRGRELDALLASRGAALLARVLASWVEGTIEAKPQDHEKATYCRVFSKQDGLLDLLDEGRRNLLKIRAFDGWPGTYFFTERHGRQIRVAVTEAHVEGQRLIVDKVIPEGKREMSYIDFTRGG